MCIRTKWFAGSGLMWSELQDYKDSGVVIKQPLFVGRIRLLLG